ncbi:hypothetical protein ACSFA3_24715, partial [Variovorax sp. RHLX14]
DLLNARFAGSGKGNTSGTPAGFNIEPSANGILGWQDRVSSQPSTVRAGDYGGSMERIARAQLGSGASQRDVNNYVGQLIEINNIKSPRAVGGAWDIALPGDGTPAATSGLDVYAKDIALGERMNERVQWWTERLTQDAQTVTNNNSGGYVSVDDAAFLYKYLGNSPRITSAPVIPAELREAGDPWRVLGSSTALSGVTIEEVQNAASGSNPNTQAVAYLRANPGGESEFQQVWNSKGVRSSLQVLGVPGLMAEAAMSTAGDTMGGAIGYNPVANQYYGPFEQQSAMWRTAAAAMMPPTITGGASTAIRIEMQAVKNEALAAGRMAELQAKWGGLGATERRALLESKSEATWSGWLAQRDAQAKAVNPRTHFNEKHGPGTTLDAQQTRAT